MSNIEDNLTTEINEVVSNVQPSGKKDIDTIVDNIITNDSNPEKIVQEVIENIKETPLTTRQKLLKGLAEQDFKCTNFPQGWWEECCDCHDQGCAKSDAYKSLSIRQEADIKLRYCVQQSGKWYQRIPGYFIGWIMYCGVSLYTIIVLKCIKGYK